MMDVNRSTPVEAMSRRDKEKILFNHRSMVEELDVEHILLYLSGTVLSKFEVDRLYTLGSRQERVTRLLAMLPTKGPLAYQHFRRSLQERYLHLVKKLDETPYVQRRPDDTVQTNTSRRVLVRSASLVLNLKPDDVITDLSREGILDDSDRSKLRGFRTDQDRSRALLDMLPLRGPTAFASFTLAVRTKQPNLADLLETTDIED